MKNLPWRSKPITERQKQHLDKLSKDLNVHWIKKPKNRGEAYDDIRKMERELEEIIGENRFSIY